MNGIRKSLAVVAAGLVVSLAAWPIVGQPRESGNQLQSSEPRNSGTELAQGPFDPEQEHGTQLAQGPFDPEQEHGTQLAQGPFDPEQEHGTQLG